jgi:hypothetical protein
MAFVTFQGRKIVTNPRPSAFDAWKWSTTGDPKLASAKKKPEILIRPARGPMFMRRHPTFNKKAWETGH